jgi:Uma2 family endonuclease
MPFIALKLRDNAVRGCEFIRISAIEIAAPKLLSLMVIEVPLSKGDFMAAIDYDSFQYYTYEQYMTWDDSWELIDGVPYAMSPAPYPRHQKVLFNISKELDNNLECSNDVCEVYISPVDWKIDETTVVQPDIALFCEETEKQFFSKTPPLVVEVLSKATALKDVTTKKELYERTGVLYYIIVEPNTEIADVYKLTDGNYLHLGKYTKNDTVTFDMPDVCSAAIDLSKVF